MMHPLAQDLEIAKAEFIERIKPGMGYEFHKYKKNFQSLSFYVDLAAYIQEILSTGRYNISILDVGPRTAYGSNFLAQLFHPKSYSRIKARITAINVDETYKKHSDAFNDCLTDYIVGDIYNHNLNYDLVIASHVIEHVPNLEKFINRLCDMARMHAIIASPYSELDIKGELIDGHINNISKNFLDNLDPRPQSLKIYHSLVWHQSPACIFNMLGRASK